MLKALKMLKNTVFPLWSIIVIKSMMFGVNLHVFLCRKWEKEDLTHKRISCKLRVIYMEIEENACKMS